MEGQFDASTPARMAPKRVDGAKRGWWSAAAVRCRTRVTVLGAARTASSGFTRRRSMRKLASLDQMRSKRRLGPSGVVRATGSEELLVLGISRDIAGGLFGGAR